MFQNFTFMLGDLDEIYEIMCFFVVFCLLCSVPISLQNFALQPRYEGYIVCFYSILLIIQYKMCHCNNNVVLGYKFEVELSNSMRVVSKYTKVLYPLC